MTSTITNYSNLISSSYLSNPQANSLLAAWTNTNATSAAFQVAANEISTLQSYIAGISSLLIFSNITALRANAVASTSVAYVQGYYGSYDGGGGLFSVKSTDTTSSDDGVSIIVDNYGNRWYRAILSSPAVAAWGGVTGNGTTDDSTAFTNVSNFANSHNMDLLLVGTTGNSIYLNSNITVNSKIDATVGGSLKPGNGKVITLSKSFIGSKWNKIFDVSSTGSFVLNKHDSITPFNFGAVGDGVTDDTSSINTWWTYVTQTGVGYVPEPTSTFLVTSNITFDVGSARAQGIQITGDGIYRSVFNSTTTTSPSFLLTCSTNPYSTNAVRISGVGFQGAPSTGTVLMLGDSAYTVSHNDLELDVYVLNSSTVAANPHAISCNGVYNGQIKAQANITNTGTTMIVRGAQYTNFYGDYGNNGNGISVSLQSGNVVGNNFQSVNFTNTSICVEISTSTANHNTFIGGNYSFTSYGANATYGSSNYFINPNFLPTTATTISNYLENAIGVVIEELGSIPQTTPSMPSSGTGLTNSTGKKQQVYLYSSSAVQLSINGVSITTYSGGNFLLNPGDTVILTYSSTPTWFWQALA